MNSPMNLAHPNNPCNGHYGKSLDVKLTNKCNCNCAFCIEKGGYSPETTLVEELIKATNSLEDYQKILILGGEPFLSEHLVEYLKGIQGKREIYITTNGSMLTSEIAEAVAPYITGINISIHHYDEWKNASVFGWCIEFEPIADAIKIFKEANVKVRINTNLVRGLFNDSVDIQKMIHFASELGAGEIRFAELQNAGQLFLSASDFFAELPDDPFHFGCEKVALHLTDFKVIVRMACGLVNPGRTVPENPVCCGSQTKVLYPHGEISDGWKTETVDGIILDA